MVRVDFRRKCLEFPKSRHTALLAHTRLTLFGTQPQRVSRVRGVSVRAAFRATREAQATALCYRNNGSHHHSWSVPNLGAGGWVPVFGPAGRRDVVTELAKPSRRRRVRRGCVYSAFPKSKHNLHRASLTVSRVPPPVTTVTTTHSTNALWRPVSGRLFALCLPIAQYSTPVDSKD